MKQKLRRLLAVLVAAMMLISALPVDALAAVIKDASKGEQPFRIAVVDPDEIVSFQFYASKEAMEKGEGLLSTQKGMPQTSSHTGSSKIYAPKTPDIDNGRQMFMGWKYADGTPFDDGHEVTIEDQVNKTVKIYADIQPIYYAYFMTAPIPGDETQETFVYRTVQALPNTDPAYTITAPTAEEYTPAQATLSGWSTDMDTTTKLGTDHDYEPGTQIKIEADTYFYPLTSAGYWIHFDSKGGTGFSSVFKEQGAGKTNLDELETRPIPTKPGYVFKGWSLNGTNISRFAEGSSDWETVHVDCTRETGYYKTHYGYCNVCNEEVKLTRHDGENHGHYVTRPGDIILGVVDEPDPLADVTLEAIWEPQTVEYLIVYWGEELTDETPYDTLTTGDYPVAVLDTATGTAQVGSSISATSVAGNKSFDYFEADGDRNANSTLTVAPGGEAVLNVYYRRSVQTINFEFNKTGAKFTIGGQEYSPKHDVDYFFKAKLGQNVAALWPTAAETTTSGFQGWTRTDSTTLQTSRIVELTEEAIRYQPYSGYWVNSTTTYYLRYRFQSVDDPNQYDVDYDYAQLSEYNFGWYDEEWNCKAIEGFAAVNSSVTNQRVSTDSTVANEIATHFPGKTVSKYFDMKYNRKRYSFTMMNGTAPIWEGSFKYEASTSTAGQSYRILTDAQRPADVPEEAQFYGWAEVPAEQISDPVNYRGYYDFEHETMPAHDLLLYAIWKVPQIRVNITVKIEATENSEELNFSETDVLNKGAKITDGLAFATAMEEIEKRGLYVAYWEGQTEDGEWVRISENDPVLHDIILRPVLASKKGYTVTYQTGEGVTERSEKVEEHKFGSQTGVRAMTYPSNWGLPSDGKDNTRPFLYWEDEDGNKYYPGEQVAVGVESVVLTAVYAQPTAVTWAVYHQNGGAGYDQTWSDVDVTPWRGYTVKGLPDGWSRPGYKFLGWSDDPSDTTAKYQPGEQVTVDEFVTNFYAIWEEAKGQLTITKILVDETDAPQGGTFTFSVNGPDGYNNNQVNITLAAPGEESVTLTNLVEGNYTVTETGDTSNYIVTTAGTQTASVESDQTTTVKFTNTRKNPKLTVEKTVGEHPEPLKAGDTITYTVTVTNSGNVPLTDAAVNDPLTGMNESIGALAVGGSKTYNTTYTVTNHDLGTTAEGEIKNTATATAKYDEKDVTASDSTTVTTPQKNPALTATKTVTNAPEGGFKAGQTAEFSITVKNSGNTVQDKVTVSEMAGATIVQGDGYTIENGQAVITNLQPGATVTVKATYKVTQDDIDSDATLKNIATVEGEGTTPDPSVDIPEVPQNPGLTATKTLTNKGTAENDAFKAGETATFDIVVKNTGNTTQHGVVVTEQLTGATIVPGDGYTVNADGTVTIPTIEVGGSVTVKAQYTVLQTDIDNDAELKNVATVKGDNGKEPDPTPEAEIPKESQNPELTVKKTASAVSGLTEGDPVHYTITVTNSGNVTLYDIDVQDELVDNLFVQQMFGDYEFPTELAPKESFTLDALYTVTAADVAAGSVTNTAIARGYTSPQPAQDTPAIEGEASVESTIVSNPGLKIEKEVFNTGKDFQKGDTIMFRVWVENTGDVTLKNVVVTDSLSGAKIEDSPDGAYTPDNSTHTATFDELKPGERQFVRVTYEVQQSDVDAGSVKNTASAKADNYPGPDGPSTSVVVDIPQHPGLTSTKTLTNEGSGENGAFNANETATFDITVTNSGNTTQKNVVVTDTLTDAEIVEGEGYTINESGNAVIAEMIPGATVTVKAKYTVTQADIDSDADLKNVAKVDGDNGGQPDPTPEVDIPEEPKTPGLTATKSVTNSGSGDNGTFKAGETATFDITVTNSGNTTQTNVTVTEQLAGATIVEGNDYTVNEDGKAVIKKMAPGDKVVVKAQYTVTQDDINSDEPLKNIAKVDGETGTDPDPEPEIPIPEEEKDARLTVDKNIAGLSNNGFELNGTVRFRVHVTNSGNVTLHNVVVTDALPGATIIDGDGYSVNSDGAAVIGEMAPGASVTLTVTYTVQEDDIRNGTIVNTATATGLDPQDKPVTGSDSVQAAPVEPNPNLTVEKTASGPNPAKLGDTITYTITVTNNGNVTVSNITVTDPLTGMEKTIDSLAPNSEPMTFKTEYTVTEADILAGEIVNTATATGEDPKGNPVKGSDTETVTDEPDPDEPDKPVIDKPAPELTVEKTATGPNPAKLNDKITYTITVTNSGNVTVSGITVNDSKTGESWTIESLAPNASETFTTTYTVTEADILAGEIVNTATATGKDPDGNPVENSDTETVTNEPDPTDPDDPDKPVLDTPHGNLTVKKTVLHSNYGYELGATVTYRVHVTNNGNVTVNDITVTDPLTGDSWKIESLAPGEEQVFTTEYTVTEADILGKPKTEDEDAIPAGLIKNTATATGTAANGDIVEGSDSVGVTTVPKNGHLTVTKTTISTPADGSAYALGETITYSVTVTNDGNLTITGITVTDELTGNKGENAWTIESLAPNGSETFEASYTVTEADILAGSVKNVATAEGKSPDPETPEVPVTPGEKEDPTQTPAPSLFVEKTADKTSDVKLGDTVTYTITVTNNGNVTVSDITVSDPLTGLDQSIGTLEPGKSAEAIKTTYTVTEADILAGSVKNTATATGTDPEGNSVTGSGDKTVTTADQNPQLAVTKTVLNINTGYDFDDTVTYHITVENTGNLTLHDVALDDALTESKFYTDVACTTPASEDNKSLAPGEKFDVYTQYIVTEAHLAGSVENTATATGTDPTDKPVTASDSVMVTTVEKNPALTSTKTLTNEGTGTDGAFKADETAEFDIVVKNTGNTTQTNVVVTDTMAGAKIVEGDGYTVNADGTATIIEIAPGESVTVKAEYTVTQTDIDNGTELANTATVDGTGDKTGPDPEPIPTEDKNPGLTTTKTLKNAGTGADGAFKAGETAEFDIVVENSGNTTQKNVVVTETMWGAKIVAGEGYDVDEPGKTATIDEIPVGGSVTVKAEYTVTQDDIDKGRTLENTATVTGEGDKTGPEPAPIPTEDKNPGLTTTKTLKNSGSGDNGAFKAGETAEFDIVVENTGNTTQHDVRVTEELAGAYILPNGNLYNVTNGVAIIPEIEPGESVTVKAYYTVTQADIDNQTELANTATVGGEGEKTGPDPEPIPTEDKNPGLTTTKKLTNGTNEDGSERKFKAGETAEFDIVVENTGNTTQHDVVVTDTMTGATIVAGDGYTVNADGTATIPTIEVGKSVTVKAEYTVTQDDIDNGTELKNTATVKGEGPTPDPDPEEIPTENKTPGLTATKSVTNAGTGEDGTFKANETAEFDITVTNSGNTTQTNVTVTEQLTGATIVEGTGYTIEDGKAVIAEMAPNATVTVKATYTVTQKDIDSGAELKNIALVDGDNGDNPDPTPGVDIPEEPKNPGLTTSKTVTNAPAGGFKAGETATFDITVTNSGNTTQTDVTVTEQLAGATITDGKGYTINEAGQAVIASMEPGATVVVKATYTVTQADIDSNVRLRNVALVEGDNGTDPDPTPGTDIPEEDKQPGLTTVKELTNSGSGEGGAFKAGETATFTITVENSGNTTQTNVTVTEGLSGAVITAGEGYTVNAAGQAVIAEMAPGAEVVVNATYTVTEADISNNRALYNTVTVGGEGTKTGPNPVPVPHEIPQPSLSSIKRLTNSGSGANGAFKAGETATFDIVVTNTGNTTQPRVVVNEMPGARIVSGTGYTVSGNSAIITNMIPGATVTVQATYTVTQADIDSDTPLRNIATVSGGGSTDPDPEPIPEEPKNPSLTTTKTLTNTGSGANGAFKAGETATFDITVRNTGNTTQTNIVVTEGMSDARILSGAGYTVNAQGQAVITSIAPGAAVVVRAAYTITQADIDTQRQIVNTATVSGGSGDKTDPDPVPVPEEQPNPGLTSTKVLSNAGTGANGAFRAGEIAQFTITVTNTGNTTQQNVVVRDTLAGATIVAGSGYTLNADGSATIASMQPGESVRITATYTVTQRDIETNAQIANTATVDGEGDTPEPDPAPIPHETPNPALTVAKTAPAGPYGAGDTITYTITVSNTGNVTVTNIAVTDPLTGMNQTIASLAPGATQTFTTTHNVTNAEVNAGRVVNTATATGSDPSGNPVTGEDSVEVEARAMVQLTVRYWFDAIGGETASPTFIRHYFVGSSYSVTSPRLAGYTCNLPVVSGTIVRNTILNVIYTGTDYTLTVTYVYEDGTTAAPTVQQTVNAGSRYSVTSPTIAGYTPNYTVVAGTMPARNVNYTVIYVPNETEILIDEYGVPLNIGNVTMNVGDCFE